MVGRIIFLIGSLIQGILCVFNISLPNNTTVLNGSCAFIPCTFDIDPIYNSDLTNNAKRMWFKDGNTVLKVFDSSSPKTALLKGSIFGKATEKNCTTRFDYVTQNNKETYYFRLEGNNNLKYSFVSRIQINVIASPPKPTLSLYTQQVEVIEGSSASLRCSAMIHCSSLPPALTWSSSPKHLLNNSIIGQQRQIQNKLISDLNFTVTHQQHRANFTCIISYQLLYRNTSNQESLTLYVQYAPKNTSVFVYPSGFVLEGHSVSLTCSSDGNPPVINYTWYRYTEGQLKYLQNGSNLIFNKSKSTDGGGYFCTAQNKHGTQNASTLLDIQYAPKNTSVFVYPSGFVLEGQSVSLTCSSEGNPPVINYTWYRYTEGQLKYLQNGSDLIFNKSKSTDSGGYFCTAQNKHGTQNTSTLLDIQYAPKNTSVFVYPSGFVLEGHSVSLICSSDGNPPVINYTWYRYTEGQLKYLQNGSDLIFNKSKSTDSGGYFCTAQNKHGIQNSSALLDIQYAPKNTSVFVYPSGFVLEGHSVSLICSSDGNPPVTNYTWYRYTEGQLKYLQNGSDLIFNKSKSTDSGGYYCTAQNKHGIQNSSVLLDIQYAPKITGSSCNHSNIITCFCEVYGNPVPTLNWSLSGQPVYNSTSTFIIQEHLGITGFRTTLTVRQTLTVTSTLQCGGSNIHGTAINQFLQPESNPPGVDLLLLAGFLTGALVMILCIVLCYFMRRKNCKPSQDIQDDSSELVLKKQVVVLDKEDTCYANAAVTLNSTESLHYTSIVFANTKPSSGEISAISSLNTEYAEVQHPSKGVTEAINSSAEVMDTKTNQSTENKNGTEVSSQPIETVYENINARLIN
nr:Schwann cell myelin protein-like isoform X2 [Misgurnus anguillicaudatus]